MQIQGSHAADSSFRAIRGTARAFTQLRAEELGDPGYTAVSLHGAEIRTQVRQLRSKYQRIIIDVGGRDTASSRAALTVADIVVVPVLPATFDVCRSTRCSS
jgi:chromosome partitioning protein